MDARRKREFGDFQTPPELARDVCRRLAQLGIAPRTVVEPTCGIGNLLMAALDQFPMAEQVLGCDINPSHLRTLASRLTAAADRGRVELRRADMFREDWPVWLERAAEPLLVLGNPPWVTNAELGTLASRNLPRKTNVAGRTGIEALTGHSNFDVSEWLLAQCCSALEGRDATLAMLCKTSVARKVLARIWRGSGRIARASLLRIDALRWFAASVDACLLVCRFSATERTAEASVFAALEDQRATAEIGWREGILVADIAAYKRSRGLRVDDAACGATPRCTSRFNWRSGVKHDCAAVMELRREEGSWINGLGEPVDVEPQSIFPFLKGADVARGRLDPLRRGLLLTQRSLQADTDELRESAPRTWEYLLAHAARLDGRRSSIYRGRPRFAMFGVGAYTFAPYKVAVCGLYKSACFRVVEPAGGRPVLFDDTVYFLPCRTRDDAVQIAALLNSDAARNFFAAFVFPDAKRPFTASLLCQLDLESLAQRLGGSLPAAYAVG